MKLILERIVSVKYYTSPLAIPINRIVKSSIIVCHTPALQNDGSTAGLVIQRLVHQLHEIQECCSAGRQTVTARPASGHLVLHHYVAHIGLQNQKLYLPYNTVTVHFSNYLIYELGTFLANGFVELYIYSSTIIILQEIVVLMITCPSSWWVRGGG